VRRCAFPPPGIALQLKELHVTFQPLLQTLRLALTVARRPSNPISAACSFLEPRDRLQAGKPASRQPPESVDLPSDVDLPSARPLEASTSAHLASNIYPSNIYHSHCESGKSVIQDHHFVGKRWSAGALERWSAGALIKHQHPQSSFVGAVPAAATMLRLPGSAWLLRSAGAKAWQEAGTPLGATAVAARFSTVSGGTPCSERARQRVAAAPPAPRPLMRPAPASRHDPRRKLRSSSRTSSRRWSRRCTRPSCSSGCRSCAARRQSGRRRTTLGQSTGGSSGASTSSTPRRWGGGKGGRACGRGPAAGWRGWLAGRTARAEPDPEPTARPLCPRAPAAGKKGVPAEGGRGGARAARGRDSMLGPRRREGRRVVGSLHGQRRAQQPPPNPTPTTRRRSAGCFQAGAHRDAGGPQRRHQARPVLGGRAPGASARRPVARPVPAGREGARGRCCQANLRQRVAPGRLPAVSAPIGPGLSPTVAAGSG
jgi:hypothetical protein